MNPQKEVLSTAVIHSVENLQHCYSHECIPRYFKVERGIEPEKPVDTQGYPQMWGKVSA